MAMDNELLHSSVDPGAYRNQFGSLVLVSDAVSIRFSMSQTTAAQLAEQLAKLLSHVEPRT